MVSGKVMSAAGCSQCRASILRLFLGPATPLVRAPLTTTASWRTLASAGKNARTYATASQSDDAAAALKDLHQAASESEKLEAASEEQASDQTPSTQDDEPWYLQVEPPRHVPASEPPPLPDVPEGSPAVIEHLLKYAAEEMGLDDLKLLDLRELDPPPALGTNLFMLFGTARSERHLNVSAGRLVRWLRAKHRIYADADGLLGPNERKTKLRRKAKRARLLGTMGTDDADDGITTGWVCVNLGTINRSHMESAVVGEDGRVAGFGVPQTGSTIVVQVMTESRRSELGLETLWERHLASQSKKQTKELEPGKDADSQTSEHPALSHASSRPTLGTSSSSAAPFSPFTGQSRSYSTQATHKLGVRHDVPSSSHFDELYAFLNGSTGSNDTSGIGSNDPASLHAASISESLNHDGAAKTRMIELLKMHLQSLQPDQVFATLKSTPFLKVSEIAMHNMPADKTWALRLSIQFKARQLGFEGYKSLGLQGYGNLDVVQELVDELRMFALPATREDMQQLLGCIYSSPGSELDEQNSLAMELLESVHLRGESVIQNDVVVAIVEGISWSRRRTTQAHELLTRLDNLIMQAKLPYMGEPLLMRLMESYARLKRWSSFWETWRVPPRYAQPRSKAMYVHTLMLAAASKDRSICTEVIQQCYQEMFMEDPVVEPVGQIREALLECIRVADPKAELHATTIPANATGVVAQALANREFVKIVRQLQQLQTNRPFS
ncbi:hypothetical protein G7054_g4276 [Neopestalotiopsis clavispora]|nr:hypothetical protein G7054_g4276 [Neopestalotiopsis clavispora]